MHDYKLLAETINLQISLYIDENMASYRKLECVADG